MECVVNATQHHVSGCARSESKHNADDDSGICMLCVSSSSGHGAPYQHFLSASHHANLSLSARTLFLARPGCSSACLARAGICWDGNSTDKRLAIEGQGMRSSFLTQGSAP